MAPGSTLPLRSAQQWFHLLFFPIPVKLFLNIAIALSSISSNIFSRPNSSSNTCWSRWPGSKFKVSSFSLPLCKNPERQHDHISALPITVSSKQISTLIWGIPCSSAWPLSLAFKPALPRCVLSSGGSVSYPSGDKTWLASMPLHLKFPP